VVGGRRVPGAGWSGDHLDDGGGAVTSTTLEEVSVARVGAHVRAVHRLDAPCAARRGDEPEGARRGVVIQVSSVAPIVLVAFTCGLQGWVPVRRLVVDHGASFEPSGGITKSTTPHALSGAAIDDQGARAGVDAGTATQASRRRTPAAGIDRAAAQPPSPPPEPQPTGTAAGRQRGRGGDPAPRRGGRPRVWTDEQMLDFLRVFAVEHGRPPAHSDFRIRRPRYCAYQRRFGSWNNALAAAGLETRSAGRPRRAA
jgi:hypothetical protein